jgi:hypothetical protein
LAGCFGFAAEHWPESPSRLLFSARYFFTRGSWWAGPVRSWWRIAACRRKNQIEDGVFMAVVSVEEVQSRAQTALASSPFYELRDLQVEWRGEALLLSGCVSSFYHKQLAQEVVRSVCRDTYVINSVHVEHEEEENVP